MLTSMLVLGALLLLVGCIWNARRFRNTHRVSLPLAADRDRQPFEYRTRDRAR